MKYWLYLSFILLLFTAFLPQSSQAASLSEKLSGRIVLSVEEKGEAWYINPLDAKRYFLGRPADAYQVMRKLGLGISNKDLEEIIKN